MSDYRIAFEEAFRFEELIQSLRLPEESSDAESIGGGAGAGVGTDDDGVWEARTASLVLVNALTNCPESLEERVMLREEFGRRGLNEVIVVSLSTFLSSELRFYGIETICRPSATFDLQTRSSLNWMCTPRKNSKTKKICANVLKGFFRPLAALPLLELKLHTAENRQRERPR